MELRYGTPKHYLTFAITVAWHEQVSKLWQAYHNTSDGIPLMAFIKGLTRDRDGESRNRLFEEPFFLRSSKRFEHLVYAVYVKCHELYCSIPINLAVGLITTATVLHTHDPVPHPSELPLSTHGRTFSAWKVSDIAVYLKQNYERFFVATNFLRQLQYSTKNRKADEMAYEILHGRTPGPLSMSKEDFLLGEIRKRTGSQITSISQMSMLAPGILKLHRMQPIEAASAT